MNTQRERERERDRRGIRAKTHGSGASEDINRGPRDTHPSRRGLPCGNKIQSEASPQARARHPTAPRPTVTLHLVLRRVTSVDTDLTPCWRAGKMTPFSACTLIPSTDDRERASSRFCFRYSLHNRLSRNLCLPHTASLVNYVKTLPELTRLEEGFSVQRIRESIVRRRVHPAAAHFSCCGFSEMSSPPHREWVNKRSG